MQAELKGIYTRRESTIGGNLGTNSLRCPHPAAKGDRIQSAKGKIYKVARFNTKEAEYTLAAPESAVFHKDRVKVFCPTMAISAFRLEELLASGSWINLGPDPEIEARKLLKANVGKGNAVAELGVWRARLACVPELAYAVRLLGLAQLSQLAEVCNTEKLTSCKAWNTPTLEQVKSALYHIETETEVKARAERQLARRAYDSAKAEVEAKAKAEVEANRKQGNAEELALLSERHCAKVPIDWNAFDADLDRLSGGVMERGNPYFGEPSLLRAM